MDSNVLVTSLISHRDQTPRVDITFSEGQRVQLEAEAAIKIGLDIVQCAMGSYIDSFVFNYIKEMILSRNPRDDNDAIAAQIVQDFRAYREKLELEFKDRQK